MWPGGFGNLHANWPLTTNSAHGVKGLKNLEINLFKFNPAFPKLIWSRTPSLRNPILGLIEWEVPLTFPCHQLAKCALKATGADSPGRHRDGTVGSGARPGHRLVFWGPSHYMPFLEWPLVLPLNQPSLPSEPVWGTGQTGLNLASPLTSREAPQTHLRFSL